MRFARSWFSTILMGLIPAQGLAAPWNSPDKGFILDASVSNGVKQNAGAVVSFSGRVLLEKIKTFSNKSPHNAREAMENAHLVLKFYFPDYTRDISSQVTVNDALQFQYAAPPLVDGSTPQFLAQLVSENGPVDARVHRVEQTLAKIRARIAKLEQKLTTAKPKQIPGIQAQLAMLRPFADKIQLWLDQNPDTVAEIRVPVQVGATPAAPSLVSAVLGKFRLSLQSTPGVFKAGENAPVHARVTFLKKPKKTDPDDPEDQSADRWLTRLSYLGSVVATRGPEAIGRAESVDLDFESPSLPASFASEALLLELYKWDTDNSHIGNRQAHLGGRIGIYEVLDSVAPAVTLGLSDPYYTRISPLSLPVHVEDASPTTTTVKLNGSVVASSGLKDFSVNLSLVAGTNTVEVQSTDSAGNLSAVRRLDQLVYDTIAPVLSNVSPGNGAELRSLTVAVSGSSNEALATAFANAQPLTLSADGKTFTGNVTVAADGSYSISIDATDLAGNTTSQNQSILIDATPPLLTLGVSDPILTRDTSLRVPFTVLDNHPTTVSLKLNGVTQGTSTELAGEFRLTLAEGLNLIDVTATDSFGNDAILSLSDIIVDTTAPTLSGLVPTANSIIESLSFPISGNSDEALASVSANGHALTLSPDKKTFGGSYSVPTEGPLTLSWLATDLAGNTRSLSYAVQVQVHILKGSLLSVAPNADGSKLVVRGAMGAVQPGLTVVASASLFNSGSVVASTNGSFSIELSPFAEALVSVNDPVVGRTETATVTYGVGGGTLLAGAVKDTLGNSLKGVRVTLLGSNLTATTDESGVFQFTQPVTGDQIIEVDGTHAISPPGAVEQRFSITKISITVGIGQSNVFQRPIYIQGTPLDDAIAPAINAQADATVTSPLAPGVALEIPADTAVFPGSAPDTRVAIATVPVEVSTLPPIGAAQPSKVTILEPSGLKFSEPVQIKLPNDNELPAGTEMMIFSMNSSKGIWEIDGVAAVSPDGQSVVTKPGQGITHFSEVYAVPTGLIIREFGSKDKPGADTFGGAVSAQITLPSVKSLGKDYAPSLVYKSSWAKPNVVVTNLFNLAKTETQLLEPVDSNTVTQVRGIQSRVECIPEATFVYGFRTPWTVNVCSSVQEEYFTSYEINEHQYGRSWVLPDGIQATFRTGSISGTPVNIAGRASAGDPAHGVAPTTDLPEKALISYKFDLRDPQSGNFFATGIYPYIAHYEIRFKQFIFATRTLRVRQVGSSDPIIERQDRFEETRELEKVIPPDLGGPLYVQNEVQSPAGRGWKVAGAQHIANAAGERVMLEEADGAISSYVVKNSVETILSADSLAGVDISQGADLSAWPYVVVSQPAARNVLKVDMRNPVSISTQLLGRVPTWGGELERWSYPFFGSCNGFNICTYPITNERFSFETPLQSAALMLMPDGKVLMSSQNWSTVAYTQGGSYDRVAGAFSAPPTIRRVNGSPFGQDHDDPMTPDAFFASVDGMTHSFLGTQSATQTTSGQTGATPQIYFGGSYGQVPRATYDGEGPAYNSAMNRPMGLARRLNDGTFVVADSGNHRVRKIDLNNNTMTTIAGSDGALYTADGIPATQLALFHPRGLAYDAQGNLYISSEIGLIHKVDTTGIITRFAGGFIGAGGELAQDIHASKMAFNKPYGMVVDNDKGCLYVADTGNHRVVRIDLSTRQATQVVGVGNQGDSTPGLPGLETALNNPTHLGLDSEGNLLIADAGNNKIKRLIFQSVEGGALAYVPAAKDHTKLLKNADGSFVRKYRNGTLANFDAQGRQISQVDRQGHMTRFFYDTGTGALSQVQDPVGRSTQYTYLAGKLTQITDPAGRVTQFQYLGELLSRVLFPDGSARSYSYNADGLLLSETQESTVADRTTGYEYNEWDRVKKITRPDGTFMEVDDGISKTIANGATGANVMSGQAYGTGTLHDSIKDVRGVETQFVKDYNGFVTKITDGDGKTTQIVRDPKSRPVAIVRRDGTWVEYRYNDAASLEDMRDDLIEQYDSFLGSSVYTAYNQFGDLTSKRNARGFETSYLYDSLGLLQSVTDAGGGTTQYLYDSSLGLPNQVFDAVGGRTSSSYDNRGNLLSTADFDGNATTYVRNLAGQVTRMTDAAGKITNYEYDLAGRLTAVVSPKGERTEYSYLRTGELAQIKDPHEKLTLFEYNVLGQLTYKTAPDGGVSTFVYDGNGNVTQEIDPNGNRKAYTYDTLNQLTLKQMYSPANALMDEVSLGYDVKGNVTRAENSVMATTRSYDPLGRLVSETFAGKGALSNWVSGAFVSHTLDANGNHQETRTSVGRWDRTFDSMDRVTGLSDFDSGKTYAFGWDQASRPTSVTRPGGLSMSYDYSRNGRLSAITHRSGGATLQSFAYEYDARGLRTALTTVQGRNAYGYDDNSQLSSATHPAGEAGGETYIYDGIGNRVQDQGGNYDYDASKRRLIEDYRYFYFYDANGNLISKQAKGMTGEVTNYQYSTENQMVAFQEFEAGSSTPVKEASYFYDALGRRVEKRVIDHRAASDPKRTFVRKYVYDGTEIIGEYSGDNALLARYTHSGLRTDDILAADVTASGVAAALAQTSGYYSYVKDALGTVTDVADSGGAKLQHYVYSAFGELVGIKNAVAADVTADPPLATGFTFTGREWDAETGLYFYRARYYDPKVGRFLQKDVNPGSIWVPADISNAHGYGRNNPPNSTDPSGKITVQTVLSIASDVLKTAGAEILAAGAAIVSNYTSAIERGQGFFKATLSATIGGLLAIGAVALSTLAITYLGPVGLLLSPAIAALGGFTNNIINQVLFNGFKSLDWGRAGSAAAQSAAVDFTAIVLSGGNPVAAAAAAGSFGISCVDNGINKERPVNTPDTVPGAICHTVTYGF